MADYILIAGETTPGTMVTPTTAYQLLNWKPDPGFSRLKERETGSSRGTTIITTGAFKAKGSIEFLARPMGALPLLLKAACFNSDTVSTPATATNSRDHVFRQSDAAALDSVSIQLQQSRNGTTKTTNIRGVVVDKITFKFGNEDFVRISMDYLAFEELIAGGTFADSSASPAAQAISEATALEVLKFTGVTGTYAGTAAQDGTTKVYTITTGTAFAGVSDFEVSISNGLEQRVFLGSAYPASIIRGDREVTFSFTLSDDTPATVFYTKARAGTQEPIQIKAVTVATIEANFNYELEVTIPLADYNAAMFGDGSGAQGKRDLTIAGEGVVWATTDEDCAIRLRDSATTSY